MMESDIFGWRTDGRKYRKCVSCFVKGDAPDISEWCLVMELEKPNRKKIVVERVMKY
jgi:hypothetical protein